MPAIILLPFTFFIPPPVDPIYWLATLSGASMVIAHDVSLFNVSAKYGAEVALRLRPLILPIVFILWLLIRPEQITILLANPLMAGAILACIISATFFLTQLRKCLISKAAFYEMIPVILTGIVFEIVNKTAMDHATFPENSLYFVFTLSGAPLLVSFLFAGKKAPAMLKDMASIPRHGLLLGTLVVFSMAMKNVAMIYTPNPAYVTAITLTAPFWISLYLKIRGEKEQADWIAGTGLVISIIIMTLLAANLPR
ncbi:MAG: hypothetical protein SFU99_07020 [Saprospiraceae bacterium]|nr:hypothetical protein [Saprospiraceae bacterium]